MNTSNEINEIDKRIMDSFYDTVLMMLLRSHFDDLPNKEEQKKKLLKLWKQNTLNGYNANLKILNQKENMDIEETIVFINDRVSKVEKQLAEMLKD